MRRLGFLALVVGVLLSVVPARAQQCMPVDAETLIAQGVAALASGEMKGAVIRDAQAAAFGADVGIEEKLLAVFLMHRNDGVLLIVVFQMADGSAAACVGTPSADSKGAIKRHFSVGA